jgi:hypothetical protein
LYPLVEIIHIVGFTVLVGAVAMFDLRLLGLGRARPAEALPVQALARHLLPWSWAGLLLIVPSGVLLFSTQPELLDNRAFLLKLALIVAAGGNALAFHVGPWRAAALWQASLRLRARLHAALSLLLWVAVIACGRLLAYV